MIASKKEASAICGTLSNTSKMPGFSINTPASSCITGGTLMNVEGSICSTCYACKGRYRFKNVQDAMQKRLAGITHPRWVEAITYLIKHSTTIAVPYFRFFDSGDLQSESHLMKIFAVANNLPEISFWLPTREHAMVKAVQRRYPTPSNLVIRISAAMVDGPPPKYATHTSTVSSTSSTCPAPQQDNECRTCRSCWDKTLPNVEYKQH